VRRLALLALLAACGDDPISVHQQQGADYNHAALRDAIGKFVAAGRTVAAYGQLAKDAMALRPGMDETVAQDCELQLVILAVGPVESVKAEPPAAQTAALATTVWPVALAPPFDVLAADGWKDPREAPVALKDDDTPDQYVQRMCDGPYATDCKYIVPEWQGAVLGTEVIARMTQRARAALANCPECSDPAWHDAVARWESLDHAADLDRRHFESEGATSRWPVAGTGAADFATDAVVLDVDDNGEWRVAPSPTPVGPAARTAALAGHPQLGVHLRPDAHVSTLDEIVADAAAAGDTQVCIGARADQFPWTMRAYCIATGTAKKPARPGRAGDTVQVFLRGLDFAKP